MNPLGISALGTKQDRWIYLVLLSALFAYILLRSISVPLVHDEVATYVHYVHSVEFMPGQALVDANNHILNSIASIISTRALGVSPLSMRLPNLLAFLLLSFFVWKLAKRFKLRGLAWCFIAGILGCHYLIEFYAASRGYGLSMAFLMGMIYHLMRYKDDPKRASVLWFVLFSGLALASNLSLLFVTLSATGLIVLRAWSSAHRWPHMAWLVLQALVIGKAINLSLFLKDSGALYYGQGDGFWSVTMETISLHLFGEDHLSPFIAVLVFAFSLFVFLSKARTLSNILDTQWTYLHLLAISLIGTFAAHFLFEANYPMDRVALYLYPLLVGAAIAAFDYLAQKQANWRYAGLIFCYLPLHFLLNANLSHFDFWYRERVPDEFYAQLEDFEETQGRMATLSGYQTTALTYFMKAHLNDYKVPPMVKEGFPNTRADFVLARLEDVPNDLPGYLTVATDQVTGNRLWQREKLINPLQIEEVTADKTSIENAEFTEFIRSKVSGAGGIRVDFDVSYTSELWPAKLVLVISTKNQAGKDQGYVPYELGWRQDEHRSHCNGTLFLDGSGGTEDEFVCYLWNPDTLNITDLKASIRVSTLSDK